MDIGYIELGRNILPGGGVQEKNMKAMRWVALSIILVASVLTFCKKEEDDSTGLLLLLGAAALNRADACSPTSSSGFVVIVPCGVAQ